MAPPAPPVPASGRQAAVDPTTAMLFSCSVESFKALRVTLSRRGELLDSAAVRVSRAWSRTALALQCEDVTRDTVRDSRFGKEADSTHLRGAHCATCGHVWRRCVMHAGVLELARPVLNPALHKQLLEVVRALAPQAHASPAAGESGLLLAYTADAARRQAELARVRAAAPGARLALLRKHAKVQRRARTGVESGVAWTVDFATGLSTAAEVVGGAPVAAAPLNGGDLVALLRRLTPADLEVMGLDPARTDPAGLLFEHLPILPTPSCPTTIQDGKLVPHHYTSRYNRIAGVLADTAPPKPGKPPASTVAQTAVTKLINPSALSTYRPKLDHKEQSMPCLKQSLERKAGAFRLEVLGKRMPSSARSNITGDPKLKHHQVGVPRQMAQGLLVPEPANDWSRGALSHLGGSVRGCLRVLTEQHAAQLRRPRLPLEDGCTVMRPLRDGDRVLFGRQPTLSNHSNFVFEVVIVDGRTLRFNPDCCPPFNADFDGDEMNIFPPGSAESAAEMAGLATLGGGLLSDATARPAVGAHQDALLGAYLLTRPGTLLWRRDVQRLMAAAGWPAQPDSTSGIPDTWRGADVLQAALAPLGPDFRWSGEGAVVAGGRLEGSLSKASVGSGAGGLPHCIARIRDGTAALAFLDALSALSHAFLRMRPPGMTFDDLAMGSPAETAVPPAVLAAAEARFAAAAGDPVAEMDAMCAHVHALHRHRVQARLEAGHRNVFTLMTREAKSKGSESNMHQMLGAAGVMQVDGRPPAHAGAGRALPTLPARDRSALARGLVDRGLVAGMTPTQQALMTGASRVGLVVAQQETPSSGYMQRRVVQCMKDCIIYGDGSVRMGQRVVQTCYGGDGGDPRASCRLRVPASELAAARAEAFRRGDADLSAAVAALARALGTAEHVSLPVALAWIIEQALPAEGAPPPPRLTPQEAEHEEEAVRAAALRRGPWEPSTLPRAALLLRLRRSERARLRLQGARLATLLEALVADWDASRAPGGMPVGVFVGTSVGPPLTQGRLNAFHTAGMQAGGAESADEAARALDRLVNNSLPWKELGSFAMTLATPSRTRDAARALAAALPAVRLAALLARPLRVVAPADLRGRDARLWVTTAAIHGAPADSSVAILLDLDPAAMAARAVSAADVQRAVGDASRHAVEPWPLPDAAPLILVVAPSEKRAIQLCVALRRLCCRGNKHVTSARVVEDVSRPGEWLVETAGTDLVGALGTPGVDASRCRSRSVVDTLRALGCEAAVAAAYREVRRLVGDSAVNRRHLSLLADFMLRTGEPLAFSRHGMANAGDGPVTRALFETPMDTLAKAAMVEKQDDLSSLLTQLMCGKVLNVGTGFTRMVYDFDAVAAVADGGGKRQRGG